MSLIPNDFEGRPCGMLCLVCTCKEPVPLEYSISSISIPPRRPLSSLSDDEAKECYRLAFDHEEKYKPFKVERHKTMLDLCGYSFALTIHEEGDMYVASQLTGEGAQFNAVAVVRYLDKLGIEIG